MLYIVMGFGGEPGLRAKESFIENGCSEVVKRFYSPTETEWKGLSGTRERRIVSAEEIGKCFYTYSNNGWTIGFAQEDIFDAVEGKCDKILSCAPENIEFISDIKEAYGSNVRLIFAYVESSCLEKIYMERKGLTDEEKAQRIELGRKIKHIYFDNVDLFDDVIVFDGIEDSFGYEALSVQVGKVIKNARSANRAAETFPYRGNDPYIFVSYSHSDADTVIPVMKKFHMQGYRVWYDKGICVGQVWREIIARRIINCSQYINFCSKNAVVSSNIRAEINLALDVIPEKIITVRMDEARYSDGYEMYLKVHQTVDLCDEDFENIMLEAISIDTKN
jgi:hypothetical protein